ncbi:type IX secretion system protein PorG [Spongiimicrobium salis]|uniref:type IX secretion system protein PorG n=1 Tax=Spongiimicrobium salis TaxID=1667022 RepID=UPI00374DDE1D
MRLFSVVILVFVIGEMSAQTYEIGAFLGGTNNIGDVGRTNYILPSGIAFGGLFKWNKSKRYAWRGSLMYGNFTADDSKSDIASREQRGFEIKNSIFEVSAGLEFNFLEYNLHKLGPAFTPYLYTGVTYFRYDFNYFDTAIGELQNLDQRDGSFAVPMIVGFKARINNELILGAEIGARYTFTDNLDASNPEGSNFEQFRFGNIFSDDWYVFSGFTLTYTFGRTPCSDCFE